MSQNQITGTEANDFLLETPLDDNILALAGDDTIEAGKGIDSVDGGVGFDKLRLDFSTSQNGVNSSLTSSKSGEYDDGFNSVTFSNIESIDVTGSTYDDVLVVTDPGSTSNFIDPSLATSYVDGGQGFDTLVADYSQRRDDLILFFNTFGSPSGSIELYSPDTGTNNRLIDFNNIESFEITGGRGNQWFGQN